MKCGTIPWYLVSRTRLSLNDSYKDTALLRHLSLLVAENDLGSLAVKA